jgi:hypothetical protein
MRATKISRAEGMVEQFKLEPSATCRNVQEAKHVRLHSSGTKP